MKWIKMSDAKPDADTQFLYFDGEIMFIGFRREEWDFRTDTRPLRISSRGYYCNRKDCSWIFDDCGCFIEESSEHCWMPLPEEPQLLEGHSQQDIEDTANFFKEKK